MISTVELIDRLLILYTCGMMYLSGLFIDETYYTQYYIISFYLTLIVDLTFSNIISSALLIIPTPVTILLNFIFGNISYLSITTMITASNVFFYTIYKLVNNSRIKKSSSINREPVVIREQAVLEIDTALIDLTDS